MAFSLYMFVCVHISPFFKGTSHTGLGGHHTQVWPHQLQLQSPYFQIRSYAEVLGIRISTCEFWGTQFNLFQDPCDYTGPIQVVQNNLPITRSLIQVRYLQVPWIRMRNSLGGLLFCLLQKLLGSGIIEDLKNEKNGLLYEIMCMKLLKIVKHCRI